MPVGVIILFGGLHSRAWSLVLSSPLAQTPNLAFLELTSIIARTVRRQLTLDEAACRWAGEDGVQ